MGREGLGSKSNHRFHNVSLAKQGVDLAAALESANLHYVCFSWDYFG